MVRQRKISASPSYQVRAVERALSILNVLVQGKGEMSLAEISRSIDLPQSTAYRLLVTLAAKDFVERVMPDGSYRLGPICLALGDAFLRHNDVRQRAIPFLLQLRDDCGETVHLGFLDGVDVVYLDKLPGLHPIGLMTSKVGGRAPAYCTGLGKALLASLTEDTVRELFRDTGLQRYTKNTITDLGRLQEELARIRSAGFAVDDEEHEEGVACVAASIRDNKSVVAAISASGPAERLKGKMAEGDLVQMVRAAAWAISGRLGGPVRS